uniref:Translationally-controlled tumor protein n=2 Tax=Felis catus TaxID=9685 RepID=A0ABI7W976_FELCA
RNLGPGWDLGPRSRISESLSPHWRGYCHKPSLVGNQLHKGSLREYIKHYVKSIKGRLEEQRPERVKPFMTGAAGQIEHILAIFKNYQSFIGENMNPGGMAAPLAYCEEGVTPYMIFFKDGLEMEKC